MIKTFLAAAVALTGLCSGPATHAQSTQDSAYTITGKVEGMTDGWVWLYHRGVEGGPMDSTQVKDGSFVFKGYARQPHLCGIGQTGYVDGNRFPISFFLQAGELTITGKMSAYNDVVVTGSPVQDEYVRFQAGQKDLESSKQKILAAFRAANMAHRRHEADSLEKEYDKLGEKTNQYVKDYVAAHPDSYVSIYEVYDRFGFMPEVPVLGPLFRGLSPAMQATYYGQQTRTALDAAERTDIGQPAPGFTQPGVNGKPVTLASFKGKYVLVDFWASWCGPCRRENPNVVKAYKKFHSKGFAILGISLDDNKARWVEAIQKDQLTWTQVSDLKGWQNSVADLYGVRGIPMNFLLDKDGKIVARGLRGEDLDKKLGELLP